MKRPVSVMSVRPDLFAVICGFCDKEANGEGLAWAEARGYGATHSHCPRCEAIHYPFMAEARAAKREGREPDYLSAGVAP